MRKYNTILVALALIVLGGCAANNNSIYYWGNYSQTAYEYQKSPSESSRQAHVQSLTAIVENAVAQHKKIPPGICAELGMLQAQNSPKLALQYFNQEKSLFPESAPLMDRLINDLHKDARSL